MSIAAVSSNLVNLQTPGYYHQRRVDLQQLGQALQSGDLAAAQQDFNAIQTLAQTGPLSNGDAFKVSQRQQDFAAIGQALQSGDLAGAQQAFAQLQATFHHQRRLDPTPAVVVNLGSAPPPVANASAAQPASAASPAAGGQEIVLNLGNATPGEQITIGLSNPGNGTEQLTISVANQNQSPEQITLNLNQSSHQQVILNLFQPIVSSPAAGNAVSVNA